MHRPSNNDRLEIEESVMVLEPMRNHAVNCFVIGSGGLDLGVVLSSIP